MVDASINLSAKFESRQPSIADLSCKFFASRYRTPNQIKELDCWGALLCIDPNGLREDQKGPIYFLLDTCVLRTGLTDKAGGFAATINDNKTSISSNGTQKRIYDMTLFESDTIYIRDNDEFLLGVQEGPSSESWTPNSGRYWFMGGWIDKRYYIYGAKTQIIANIEGKCYMDLWKENFFGTGAAPRNYNEAVDILQVVVDLLHDMNAIQDSDYEFRSHPDNFPGSPLTVDVASGGTTITVESTTPFQIGNAFIWDNENYTGETVSITAIPSTTQLTIVGPGIASSEGYSLDENAWIVMSSELTGVSFLKEFSNSPMFGVLQDLCERAEYEWKVTPYPTGITPASRRALEFYPRVSAPRSEAQFITYNDNIRQLPSIMVGDTTNLVTNALVTGKPVTFPEDKVTWINTGIWPDLSSRNRYYSIASTPPPPNAFSQAFADTTLILDDELNAALNLQKDSEPIFNLYLSLFAQTSTLSIATLDLDLRKWRRIKFRFRHATAKSPTITLTVADYLALAGSTITVVSSVIDGASGISYLIEGVDWDAEVNNDTTAENIRVAIENSRPGILVATRVGAVITITVLVIVGPLAPEYWLTYIDSTASAADLVIDTSEVNLYRIGLNTYDQTYAGGVNIWNRRFYYDFGKGVVQSSEILNDPVVSNHDIVKDRGWNEIDILLPDVNPDGTIGSGTVADLYDDDYMHGWRPVFLTGPPITPDTTADPTNIDFLDIDIQCTERGAGGLSTDAPGSYVRNLSGTNKTFASTLPLAAAAQAGDVFLDVANAYRMAGDYLPGTGSIPTEARVFREPYPEYVIWRNSANWEAISIAGIADSGGLYPDLHGTGDTNVRLETPLVNSYATGEILCRGGWNISFSQLHFTPGSIDKSNSLPSNLANPKRYRLVSSDDVEYLLDVEGLGDQTLLDSAAYQGVKITLDGDPRRRIGLRVIPYLDPLRAAAGLPTIFHGIDMVIDAAEHHIVSCSFFSTFMLGTIATRGKERVMAAISGQQEAKLARTSYGTRVVGSYQRK